MQRYLEPELMVDNDQAVAFLKGTKDYGIQAFLNFYKQYIDISKGAIVDLGCGTGEYLFALEEQYPNLQITGYDGSETMLHIGRGMAEYKSSGVRLRYGNFEDLVDKADCVISTNTLHHLHDPLVFWQCVKRISNNVFVMDLVRPNSVDIAKNIVDTLAKDDDYLFKQDYYNSLLAAFSKDELEKQIEGTNLKLEIQGDSNFLQVAIIHGVL